MMKLILELVLRSKLWLILGPILLLGLIAAKSSKFSPDAILTLKGLILLLGFIIIKSFEVSLLLRAILTLRAILPAISRSLLRLILRLILKSMLRLILSLVLSSIFTLELLSQLILAKSSEVFPVTNVIETLSLILRLELIVAEFSGVSRLAILTLMIILALSF